LINELLKPKFLKDCIDTKQLLIASLWAYCRHFNPHQCSHHEEAYIYLVIGFIQSLQDPQLGKMLCQGLDDVMMRNVPISDRAARLEVEGGQHFYRLRNESDLVFNRVMFPLMPYAAVFMKKSLEKYIEEQSCTVSFLSKKCHGLLPQPQIRMDEDTEEIRHQEEEVKRETPSQSRF